MRWPAALLALCLAACGGVDSNPVVPDPQAPVVAPTPAAVQAPTPTPTPAPEPTRTPRANRPPTVALSFAGPSQCHPHPQPCSVPLRAEASDPDGDRLTYSWSGCAFGTDALADCRVTGPMRFEATVEVSDARGGVARASIATQGINLPPDFVFAPTLPPQPSQSIVRLYGNISDPESGGLCGHQYCLDARVTGPCGPSVFFDCTCLGGAEAEVRTANGPGLCTLEVRVRDDLGAVATLTTRFTVLAP
jgi:hypothetical protein